MGNYATRDELKARFESTLSVAHLTDTSDTGTPSNTVLDEVLQTTEAWVNSYLARRYAVPINVTNNDTVAEFLRGLTLDEGQYRLSSRSDHVSTVKDDLHKMVLDTLRDIAKGDADLPSESVLASASSLGQTYNWGVGDASEDSKRLCTRETMKAV